MSGPVRRHHGPGAPAAPPDPSRASGPRSPGVGVDRRAGRRRRGRVLARSPRCSCGSTAGWVSRSCRRVIGPAWHWLDPFSTLHDLGACGHAASRHRARGRRRTTRPGWAAGRRPSGSPRSSGSSSSMLAVASVDPVHRGRRLHRVHPRDDGPVRAGHVALERRGLHGLVPAPRSPRGLRAGRRDGSGRRRPFAAGLLEPGWIDRGCRARRRSAWVRSCSTGCPRRRSGSTSSERRASSVRPSCWSGGSASSSWRRCSVTRDVGVAATGAGLLPDRGRVSRRALPDLPAHRRSGHRHRARLIPSSAAGTCSARPSTSRRERGCRRASCGRRSWRPWWVDTCWARGPVT